MTPNPPGTWRVLCTLAGSAGRRLLRTPQLAGALRAAAKTAPRRRAPDQDPAGAPAGASPPRRVATRRPRAGHGMTLLMVLMLPLMLLNSLQLSARAVSSLAHGSTRTVGPLQVAAATHRMLERTARELLDVQPGSAEEARLLGELRAKLVDRPDRNGVPTERIVEQFRAHGLGGFTRQMADLELLTEVGAAGDPAARAHLATAGALLLLLTTAVLVLASIGSANLELGRAAWTLPWLLTFPVPTRAIVLAKVGEYSLVQMLPWFTVFPLTWQLLRGCGLASGSWALAAVACLSLCALTGSLRCLLETWLRLRRPLQTVRSVQGLCAMAAIAGFGLLFALVMPASAPRWFHTFVAETPPWLVALPTSWALAAVVQPLPVTLASLLLLAAAPVAATWACSRLLRHGTERSSGVDPGRGKAGVRRPFVPLGILKKDLLLLARDRNFLAQTIGVPVFVVGMQWITRTGDDDTLQRLLPVTSYFAGVMALSTGCLMVLSSEGRALWLLYALPARLADLLRRKVLLWAGIAVAMALTTFVLASGGPGGSGSAGDWWLDAACLAAGVFGAAWLAAGIGSLGTDPAADHVPRHPKQRYVYLYLYLAGSYVLGLASDELARRAAALLVFGTLAWSLWQRLGDRLPWLLDPHARQPRDLSAYDAGAAVTTFFLLQALLAVVCSWLLRDDGLALVTSYVGAGALTVGLFLAVFRSRGLDLRARLGFAALPRAEAVRWTVVGLLAGVGLGALGLAWLRLVRAAGWFEQATPPPFAAEALLVLLLATLAAPLVEELLFRGILFHALQRSVPTWLACGWSAALLAVLHPVVGWPPVFAVGLATAMLLARSRFLPACMVLHGAYNLVVVTLH